MAGADVVVLAVPYGAVSDVAQTVGTQGNGKVIIDATNPLKPDFSGLAVSERSGAEEVQELFAGATVVKAFNTVLAANQATGSVEGTQLDGFYAGDDEQAKQVVPPRRPVPAPGARLAWHCLGAAGRHRERWRSGVAEG